jgi:hypothetical protein
MANKHLTQPQEELYERINLGLFRSKTNSEINFSSSSSGRENKANPPSHKKRMLTIECSDDYIINQYFCNTRIKNMDIKRV